MSDTVKKIMETYRLIEDLGEDLKVLFAQLDKENKEEFERSFAYSNEHGRVE